jgi:hypothetical protein
MFNSHADRFQIRDVVNNVAMNEFMTWDDAAEWAFDFKHDILNTVDSAQSNA